MLRSTVNAVAFGAALWAFAWLGELAEPFTRAAAAVALGTAVTALAYGEATFLSIGAGALSPLAFALLEKHSLSLAACALCAAWLSPRLVLADSPRKLKLLAALSSASAAVAGLIFAAYVDSGWAPHVASCLFAGSCLSLVCLVRVDTTIALALRTAASAVPAPAREALERAARCHRESPARAPKSRWRALVRLADQRAALERMKESETASGRNDLDERIADLAEELAPTRPAGPPVEPGEAPESACSPGATPGDVSFGTHARDPADIPAE